MRVERQQDATWWKYEREIVVEKYRPCPNNLTWGTWRSTSIYRVLANCLNKGRGGGQGSNGGDLELFTKGWWMWKVHPLTIGRPPPLPPDPPSKWELFWSPKNALKNFFPRSTSSKHSLLHTRLDTYYRIVTTPRGVPCFQWWFETGIFNEKQWEREKIPHTGDKESLDRCS